jgi:hypothetical protein
MEHAISSTGKLLSESNPQFFVGVQFSLCLCYLRLLLIKGGPTHDQLLFGLGDPSSQRLVLCLKIYQLRLEFVALSRQQASSFLPHRQISLHLLPLAMKDAALAVPAF